MNFRPFGMTPPSLNNLQDEMSRILEKVWHGGISAGPFDGQSWAPTIDVHEHNGCYVFYSEVPGVAPDTIDVSYLGGVLTIRGNKAAPAGIDGEPGHVLREERRFGAFSRSIELPPGSDHEKLTAACRDGVLTITIPKSASAKPKSVRVNVSE